MGGRQTLTASPPTTTDIFLSLGCVRHPKHLGVFVYINSCYPQSNFWCYRYYSLFIHKESTEWWGDLVNVTQLESGAGIPILLASSFLSFKKQNDNIWLQRVSSKREIWQIHWAIGLASRYMLSNDDWVSKALGHVRWTGTSLTLWVNPPGTSTGFVEWQFPG